MPFIEALPAHLREGAYLFRGEAAWAHSEALQVIDHLSAINVAVSRIELWLPTPSAPTIPTPFIYNWEADDQRPDEELASFVGRVNEDAGNYVRQFQWDKEDTQHHSMEPYFNLDAS